MIESCLKELGHANAKPSTVHTYTKHWSKFAEVFEELPLDRAAIMDYLARFDGSSGRYRLNNQDNIHLLYKQAYALGWIYGSHGGDEAPERQTAAATQH